MSEMLKATRILLYDKMQKVGLRDRSGEAEFDSMLT